MDDGPGCGFGLFLFVLSFPIYYGFWGLIWAISDHLGTIFRWVGVVGLSAVVLGLVVVATAWAFAAVQRWRLRPVLPKPPTDDEMAGPYGTSLRLWEGSATSPDGRSVTGRLEYETRAENRATPDEAHAWEDVADRRLLREHGVVRPPRERPRDRHLDPRTATPRSVTPPPLANGQAHPSGPLPLPESYTAARYEPTTNTWRAAPQAHQQPPNSPPAAGSRRSASPRRSRPPSDRDPRDRDPRDRDPRDRDPRDRPRPHNDPPHNGPSSSFNHPN